MEKYIHMAITDTRDIILWAEYEKSDDATGAKRLRDFNNRFKD